MTCANNLLLPTLKDDIVLALEEANILEMGRDTFDENNMLTVAMRLSGAPWSFVEQVYTQENTQ